jgi:hypothetical protein
MVSESATSADTTGRSERIMDGGNF